MREDRAAGVVLASGEEIAAATRRLERRSQDDLPRAAGQRASRCRLRAPRDASAHPRPRREAAPGARSRCRSSPELAPAGAARPAAGRAVARLHRARLQPRQVRRVLGRADARDHAADAARSGARARRASTCSRRSCSTRPTRSPAAGRPSGSASRICVIDTLERYAPGLRESIMRARAADAAGHRARVPHQRRPLASRRAGARPVLHGAPGARRGAVPRRRVPGCSCAARAVTRAAASWASPGATPRARS